MIFIYEIQEQIPKGCSADYKKCYPLFETKNQYKFLYQLDITLINQIDRIYFIHNEGLESKLYKDTCSRYSTEISDYVTTPIISQIFELSLLPLACDLQDKEKRVSIESLIRKQIFCEVNEPKTFIINIINKEEILICLPYKKEITQGILTNTKNWNSVHIFSNYQQMMNNDNSGFVEIEPKKYLDIDKKLRTIVSHKVDEFTDKQYYFEPKKLLEIFDKHLPMKLSFSDNRTKNRLQVNGDEFYLAKRFINHLMQNRNHNLYNLMQGIPQITNHNAHLIFFHFDALTSNDECNKLSNYIKNIKKEIYIILQSTNKISDPNFSEYPDIRLPNREMILNVITYVAIIFLNENSFPESDYPKLYPLIQNNSFLSLLNEYRSLENLYVILSKLRGVTASELLTNAEMWYYIISEMTRMDNETAKNKIIFDFSGDAWEIHGLGKKLTYPYSSSLGIKYIASIIYFHKLYNKGIHVNELSKLVHALDNDSSLLETTKQSGPVKFQKTTKVYSSKSTLLLEQYDRDRLAIYDCLSRTKKTNESINKFCKDYIKYQNYEYWFLPKDEIDCEVNHPKMNPAYFVIDNK